MALHIKHKTLREWRDSHGWTIREAAAVIGISHTAYQNIERGAAIPRRELLAKIAAITGVDKAVLAQVA